MQPQAPPSYEMASVLFLDIVGYSLQPLERQGELIATLQQVVRGTTQFKQASSSGDLICLPTGDGMALVFFRDPVSPVRCAVEIATMLRDTSQAPLRMGIHTGPVQRHADIKNQTNVIGGGINMSQRVMDCGDAGHILVSRTVGEVLEQFNEWRDALHDLGMCEVKHGVRMQLYNLYRDGVGNPRMPKKLMLAQRMRGSRARWKWPVIAALAIVIAATGWYLATHFSGLGPAPRGMNASSKPGTERTLQYYVIVQKYRDGKPYQQQFRLSGERVFEADYRIRLMVSSPESGYLYVLNEGPQSTAEKPDYNTLFPSSTTGSGSAELEPSHELGIPEGGYFKFDAQRGKEKLWFVWSKASLPELEALKRWANPVYLGRVQDPRQLQAIRSFLEKKGAAKPSVEQDESKQMTILRASGDILVRLLQLEHD